MSIGGYRRGMARLAGIAPVFTVSDLDAALIHYGRLGFATRPHAAGGYAEAQRDGVHLHLALAAEIVPLGTAASAAYILVDDADALYTEWSTCGATGRFSEPIDNGAGLLEGRHVDTDGNQLRFASPIT